MTELTDEMIAAYRDARAALNYEQMHGRPPASPDTLLRAGLAAVLAIVDRDSADLGKVARRAYENGQRDERALTELGF
jgi:hypothetical protein